MGVLPLLKLAGRVLASSRSRLDFPYKLNFALTCKCNCRCKNCFIWAREEDELSTAEIRKFFEKSNRFSWVDVTGGEIFLREDLDEVLDIIIENCRALAYLHFPTNGTMPEKVFSTASRIIKITGASLVVTVSLDGPRELHDELRGLPGTFDRALETFRLLKTLPGVGVFFGMTLSEKNLGLFEETLKAVREVLPGVSPVDFHFNIPHRSDHYYGNAGVTQPDMDGIAREFARLHRLRPLGLSPLSVFERRYAEGVGYYCGTGKSPIPCAALSASAFLNQSGVLYPCTILSEPLGNIRDCAYDLETLWNLPSSKLLFDRIQRGECPGCWTSCEAFPAIGRRLALPLPTGTRTKAG
ncbi:radical SAM protein [bacterium]|nr:MAG: radical SAM protein [bacterium]